MFNNLRLQFLIFDVAMNSASKYTSISYPSWTWNYFKEEVGGYRFRFNVQEQDNEVAGILNIMTTEFRMYDGRLGRRWCILTAYYLFIRVI